MSRGVPVELLKQLGACAAIAARRRVARLFVLGYHSAAAIRLTSSGPRRRFARRQLVIDPRRVVS